MSNVQERSFSNDVAAAVGNVIRARGNGNLGNYGHGHNASDVNLAAQIAPVVLTSLRTLAQRGGQHANNAPWQQAQPGYQTQQGLQAQQGQQYQQDQQQNHGQQGQQQNQGQQPQGQQHNGGQQYNQGQQQNQGQQPQQGYGQGFQQQGYQQPNGSSQATQLSSRGTLAAVITPIVAEALTRYQPTQNTGNGYNQPRPLDRDWLESISSVVADVTPAVVDALKNFAPQNGAQNNFNATNLQAAAQRGAFDDLTSVVAATVPVVINALRDYQPQQAQSGQGSYRNGSDDVFDVARLAAPIAIAAL